MDTYASISVQEHNHITVCVYSKLGTRQIDGRGREELCALRGRDIQSRYSALDGSPPKRATSCFAARVLAAASRT